MRKTLMDFLPLAALFIGLFSLPVTVHSQDMAYARNVLETLCSPEFHGRGYYENGDSIAADYIAREFIRHGLQTFEMTNDEAINKVETYLQEFRHPVNTINGHLAARLTDRPRRVSGWPSKPLPDEEPGSDLEAGVDYIVSPSAPSYEGIGKLYILTKKQHTSVKAFSKIIDELNGRFVVINPSYLAEESDEIREEFNEIRSFLLWSGELEMEGVIELAPEKLTWTAASQTAPRPHLYILEEAFQKARAGDREYFQLKVESTFISRYLTRNVVGYVEGNNKDSFICIVGHYDHLGRMGHDIYFPGANDNASGIAMLLSLAKYYGAEENKPDCNIVFIAFGAEEIGLVGSRYFVKHSPFPIDQIKFLINLDILGTGEEGIQVVNGAVHERAFARLQALNSENTDDKADLLKQVKTRGPACNSDHCYFHEANVPSFFIYTLGGIAHYHNIYDKAETLPLTEFPDLFVLLRRFVDDI